MGSHHAFGAVEELVFVCNEEECVGAGNGVGGVVGFKEERHLLEHMLVCHGIGKVDKIGGSSGGGGGGGLAKGKGKGKRSAINMIQEGMILTDGGEGVQDIGIQQATMHFTQVGGHVDDGYGGSQGLHGEFQGVDGGHHEFQGMHHQQLDFHGGHGEEFDGGHVHGGEYQELDHSHHADMQFHEHDVMPPASRLRKSNTLVRSKVRRGGAMGGGSRKKAGSVTAMNAGGGGGGGVGEESTEFSTYFDARSEMDEFQQMEFEKIKADEEDQTENDD